MPSDQWLKTASFLSKAFKEAKIEHAVYGSGAALLHGVNFASDQQPNDIDISVANVPEVRTILTDLVKQGKLNVIEDSPKASLAVKKFRVGLKGDPLIGVDITYEGEFGLAFVKKIVRENIIVISALDTLLSLYLRNPKREKDIHAANELFRIYGSSLTESSEFQKNKTPGFKAYVLATLASAELKKVKKQPAVKDEKKAVTVGEKEAAAAAAPKNVPVKIVSAGAAPRFFSFLPIDIAPGTPSVASRTIVRESDSEAGSTTPASVSQVGATPASVTDYPESESDGSATPSVTIKPKS